MNSPRNATLVARARTDRNGVIVNGVTYYHPVEKIYWLSKSEFVTKVMDEIKERYQETIEYNRLRSNRNMTRIPYWKR